MSIFKINTNKGFTLIELLVVIAIIGMLSSIVLASLSSARTRGGNAAVKQNMNSIRAQAELVYDINSGFYSLVSGTSVCTDSRVVSALNAAISAGGDSGTVASRCNNTSTAWAVNARLKTPEGTSVYWCIDNSGRAKGEATELGGATACP
jgi:prepilin-type N-terminal cleavage/methylation domain-containing protein